MDHLCFFLSCVCYAFCLFICALWSTAGKGLTSWLSFLVSNCEFVTLGQVWYFFIIIIYYFISETYTFSA